MITDMKHMMFMVCALTLSLVSVYGHSSFSSKNQTFNGLLCTPISNVFGDTPSAIRCGVNCDRNPDCLGYFHSSVHKSCLGINFNVTSTDSCNANETFRFYRKIENTPAPLSTTSVVTVSTTMPLLSTTTPPEPVGGPCTTNNDCIRAPNTVCIEETCVCDADWKLNPANMSCVAECAAYGTNFTRFPDRRLSHLDMTLQSLSNTPLSHCFEQCASHSDCRSFNFSPTMPGCWTKAFTKREKPLTWESFKGRYHYVRNCL